MAQGYEGVAEGFQRGHPGLAVHMEDGLEHVDKRAFVRLMAVDLQEIML